jgi:acylphosphatase
MDELHAIVRGRVQLVMFRDFTRRRARRLHVAGFVRNRSDGSVEVVAQGEKPAVEKLLETLHRGSLLSRVDSVECEWRATLQKMDDFLIAY